ncbi:metabolite traffic protein EboE [Solicola gregarius]|uniref:Metabolite traffic protein EboE n=1 Tax=Solicola gregarius TaxID=2908642 RepID=A0AA46YPC9_9ACTN|nr:metabolite traffic protein EboE [Solicola gregarius]UYM07483.1 metabolite traffic protein EboE [Solicola gregarius]
MRFRHRDGTLVHLAYGTNVLPAEDVDGIAEQAVQYGSRLRTLLDAPRIGLGMWLPAEAAHRLASSPADVRRLRDRLASGGVEIVTLNAFPYADFQGSVVKKNVYHPAWNERARLDYTVAAATVLANLLPDDVARGSISSLPLGWHAPWLGDRQAAAMAHLNELAEALDKLEADTGRSIRVGLEPEPGCAVETIADAVERLGDVDRTRIGVCLDLCHLAVGFEDMEETLAKLDRAGLPVVKTQPAAALHVDDPADAATRDVLHRYAEDRFLHQVRSPGRNRLATRDDLPDALDGHRPLHTGSPWRVHFHVPVHADPEAPLRSTRDELHRSLDSLLGGPQARVDHLEVETYTWSVLPGAGDGPDALARGLAAELAHVRDALIALGLEEAA